MGVESFDVRQPRSESRLEFQLPAIGSLVSLGEAGFSPMTPLGGRLDIILKFSFPPVTG